MTSTPAPPAGERLSSELRLAVMRLARRLRQEREDTGLGLGQLAALATLDRLGPLTPGELAGLERVRPPSMTRCIAVLVEHGLVRRSAHPVDRRQVVVEVTGSGSALLRADRSRRDAWLDQRLAELTEAERDVLARAGQVLERLAAA